MQMAILYSNLNVAISLEIVYDGSVVDGYAALRRTKQQAKHG
jgi:hypothetical protein